MNPHFDLSLITSLDCFHDDVFGSVENGAYKQNKMGFTNTLSVEEQLRTVTLSEIQPIPPETSTELSERLQSPKLPGKSQRMTTFPRQVHSLYGGESANEQNENGAISTKRSGKEKVPYHAATLDDDEPSAKRNFPSSTVSCAGTLEKKPKPPKAKRKKACQSCKKSHVVCEGGYPCLRCIKRNIGHLCTEETLVNSSPMTKFTGNDRYMSSGYKPTFASNPFMLSSLPSFRKTSYSAPNLLFPKLTVGPDDSVVIGDSFRSKTVSYLPEYSTGQAIVSNSQFPNDGLYSSNSKTMPWNAGNSQPCLDHSLLGTSPIASNPLASQPYGDSSSLIGTPQPSSNSGLDALLTKFIHYFNFKLNMYYAGNGQFQDFWLLEEYRLGLLWPYDFQQRLQSFYAFCSGIVLPAGKGSIISLLDRLSQHLFPRIGAVNLIDLLRHEELYESICSLFNRTTSTLSVSCALWRIGGDIGSFTGDFGSLIGVDGRADAKKEALNIFSLLHQESVLQLLKYLVDSCENPDVGPLEISISIRGRASTADYVRCMLNLLVLTDPMKMPCAYVGIFTPLM